jgi:hypothetical protein
MGGGHDASATAGRGVTASASKEGGRRSPGRRQNPAKVRDDLERRPEETMHDEQ